VFSRVTAIIYTMHSAYARLKIVWLFLID